MESYILAHDLGTSGNKATLFREDGSIVSSRTVSYPVFYDRPLYAEQDAADWWRAVCESTKELLQSAGVSGEEVAAVSFSGQMMGCLPVDREGNPLRRAIIWADQRAQAEAAALAEKIDDRRFYGIVGHRNTASYGIQKAMWIRNHEPEVYDRTWKFLNAKDYIVYKLTGQARTDPSDANSAACFDLRGLCWSEEIVRASGIDPDKLPEIVPSTAVVGCVTLEAAMETGLSVRTKVVMGAGDGVAANVGAGCVAPGNAYCCMGTSAWVASTSEEPAFDEERRIVCWAHAVPGLYSPNATMQYAGGSYAWMKETLCGEEALLAGQGGASVYERINEEIRLCERGAGGVIFLPYLMGERAPRWQPEAKGLFYGLTATTKKQELLRSVLEGVVMNLGICFDILNKDGAIRSLTLIGGAARSDQWPRTIADVFGVPVAVPALLEESNSMGAAIIAGVGSGIYPDFSVCGKFVRIAGTTQPAEDAAAVYAPVRERFEALYQAVLPLYLQ